MGALIAIVALTLPGFTVAILLSMLYLPLKDTLFFEYMNEAVLPAALGLIVLAITNLSKDVITSKLLILFATISFVMSFFFGMNATTVLFLVSLIAAVTLSFRKGEKNVTS